jgi:hypothetical protein
VGLLFYHIEQYIGVYGYHALKSLELLEKVMEWRNQKFEEDISFYQQEKLLSVVRRLQRKKAEGDKLYAEIRNSFYSILPDWEALITAMRNDRHWNMTLEDDENFRRDFKNKVIRIKEALRVINDNVEKLLSPELLPVLFIDEVPSRIRIFMDYLPYGFRDAYWFFGEVLEYVEEKEEWAEGRKREEETGSEEGEEQPVGPVKRAISAIRSLMQRIFPAKTQEEEVSEEAGEDNEATPG